MIIVALALWLIVAAGVLHAYRATVAADPETAPGGGDTAMIITSLAWPLIVALGIVALFALFLDAIKR